MDWMSSAGKARKIFEQPVNKAVGAIAGIFSTGERMSPDEMRVLALFKTFLPQGEAARTKAFNRLFGQLERQGVESRKIHEIMLFLESAAPGTAEAALPVLKQYDRMHQSEVLSGFLTLAIERGDYRPDALETIGKIAQELGFAEGDFDEMKETVLTNCTQRTKLLKSGTGIILAVIVIVLFILTATWLSSLLFGVALAYIFLPLEQLFERRFFALEKINCKVSKKGGYELSEEELLRRSRQARTNKATYLTVGLVVIAGLILSVLLGMLVCNYLGSVHSDIENWMHKQQLAAAARAAAVYQTQVPQALHEAVTDTAAVVPAAAPTGGIAQLNASLAGYVGKLQERFQELPVVQGVLTEISNSFASGEAQRNLGALMLKKSGGVFAFLAKFIASFAGFLLNLLLTVFFFSLILSQLATYVNNAENTGKRASSYLVRTVFSGSWLPAMSEEDLANGARIIGESINKLKVWLRGYLTMVIIDMCVYTLIFWWLDVPYFGILGLIAGLGILLPYIGPVSGALLTIIVTLIAGDGSLTQIIGIVLTFSLYNGVFEQFFSYPYFIGDKLGLTTLETIIVVLLGGILAGIPGMIFALPASAVLKYIVPQIYRCWK